MQLRMPMMLNLTQAEGYVPGHVPQALQTHKLRHRYGAMQMKQRANGGEMDKLIVVPDQFFSTKLKNKS